jgi:hypothetical protein
VKIEPVFFLDTPAMASPNSGSVSSDYFSDDISDCAVPDCAGPDRAGLDRAVPDCAASDCAASDCAASDCAFSDGFGSAANYKTSEEDNGIGCVPNTVTGAAWAVTANINTRDSGESITFRFESNGVVFAFDYPSFRSIGVRDWKAFLAPEGGTYEMCFYHFCGGGLNSSIASDGKEVTFTTSNYQEQLSAITIPIAICRPMIEAIVAQATAARADADGR